jgi:hypothetical protein
VEQQKAGPSANPAMLSEIAQDVKQLQTMASVSKTESSPEQSSAGFGSNYFQGFPLAQSQPQPGFIPQPAAVQQPDRHIRTANRTYADTVVNTQSRQSSTSASSYPSGPLYSQDPNDLPREHQRRRLRPPTPNPTFTPPSQDADADDETGDSEIVQMAGQLSLDENKTVRYHGSSSGLTLLTRSKRFDGTFWNMPNPGFWPASDRRTVKTELEIDSKTQLPPIATQDRLFEYHPSFPVSSFRQLMVDYIGNIFILMCRYFIKIIS